MATETTRTSGRDIKHKAVWHCEDEALQNVSNYCRRLTNTDLTLTVVARGELPTDVNDGCLMYSSYNTFGLSVLVFCVHSIACMSTCVRHSLTDYYEKMPERENSYDV